MTVAPGLLRAGLVFVVLVLAGAFAFGSWHVIVGGLVNGNPRAATFGIALATVSAGSLVAIRAARRRFGRA